MRWAVSLWEVRAQRVPASWRVQDSGCCSQMVSAALCAAKAMSARALVGRFRNRYRRLPRPPRPERRQLVQRAREVDGLLIAAHLLLQQPIARHRCRAALARSASRPLRRRRPRRWWGLEVLGCGGVAGGPGQRAGVELDRLAAAGQRRRRGGRAAGLCAVSAGGAFLGVAGTQWAGRVELVGVLVAGEAQEQPRLGLEDQPQPGPGHRARAVPGVLLPR